MAIKKKEGFRGQKAIAIPRSILHTQCETNEVAGKLYITDIGYYPKAEHHYRMRPNGSDQHILLYCVDGKGTVSVLDQVLTMEAGDFCFIPRNTRHTYQASPDKPWTIYWIHFKGSTADYLVQFAQEQSGIKGFISAGDRITELFHDIYQQLERGYGIKTLIHVNLSFGYLLTCFSGNEPASTAISARKQEPADVAIDYIRKHIDQPLTLGDIAQVCNLSPNHFTVLFKRKTGFTVIEYFNHLKIQRACQYLLFTDLRIKEIAESVGLPDQHYFSRVFKKVMGVSPLDYRQKRSH
ncbi:AraC-like ligand binding domain-containing protein [Filimonas lacunae]|uniref:AraC-like ligand binding domain-containing protein n=1 Tax=Filimonas lacunae TaxID=477680 RepID=A0A173MGE6_9BACT|nr:AraC family transcriptional regulator [Filimonas lacunae]BAV06673.1 DNA-binding response regulator, AraC family [Filimonas lacunae]SIT27856.1 AraC-like ligand binding domain-containing protein [Filimonas lacunae]